MCYFPSSPLISTEQSSAVLKYLSHPLGPVSFRQTLTQPLTCPGTLRSRWSSTPWGDRLVPQVALGLPARVLLAPAPVVLQFPCVSRAGTELDLLQGVGLSKRANSLHLN